MSYELFLRHTDHFSLSFDKNPAALDSGDIRLWEEVDCMELDIEPKECKLPHNGRGSTKGSVTQRYSN